MAGSGRAGLGYDNLVLKVGRYKLLEVNAADMVHINVGQQLLECLHLKRL